MRNKDHSGVFRMGVDGDTVCYDRNTREEAILMKGRRNG